MNGRPPRKHFGQHFLHDRNILDKIVTAIRPEADQHFVEIGPGRGALTRPLLELCASLHAVEIDRDLAAALPDYIASPALTVHVADALRFDFAALRPATGRLRLAGNLPYNVSTPLLFHILGYDELFGDIHVMLQKEVAQRIVAGPGSRTYGRLGVAITARCEVETLFHIRPGSFTPPPRVDSSFIRLRPDAANRPRIRHPQAFDPVLPHALSPLPP